MNPHVGENILSFIDLGLHSDCIDALEHAGYKKPTELQTQLIPLVNQKKNVLIKNHSASGKTGAFLIPAINYILNNPIEDYVGTRILVLTSRKDRVNQIKYTIKRIGDQAFRFGFIVSGRPYQPQMRLLRRPLDMLIATPGRLNDLAENGKADFSNLEMLIIDDLSSVYHKEFQGLVDRILADKKTNYPIIVFTRDEEEVLTYAKGLIPDAVELEVEEDVDPITKIPQSLYQVDDYTHKIALMDYMLDEFQGKRTLICVSNVKSANTLAENMTNHGHTIDVASNLSESALENHPAIVVSDHSKQALPSYMFDHVVHFEMPKTLEAYKERMVDKDWDELANPVVFLLGIQEREVLQRIEGFLGYSIPIKSMPGLDPMNPFAILPPIKPVEKKQAKKQKKDHRQQDQQKQGYKNRQNTKSGKFNRQRPQQNKNDNKKHASSHAHSANANSSNSDKSQEGDRRGRKGAYGRLNGGVHRKRETDPQGNVSQLDVKKSASKNSKPTQQRQHQHHNQNNANANKPDIKRKRNKINRSNFVPSIMSDGSRQTDYPVLKERGESTTDENKVVVKYKEKRWGSFNN